MKCYRYVESTFVPVELRIKLESEDDLNRFKMMLRVVGNYGDMEIAKKIAKVINFEI